MRKYWYMLKLQLIITIHMNIICEASKHMNINVKLLNTYFRTFQTKNMNNNIIHLSKHFIRVIRIVRHNLQFHIVCING